KVVSRWPSRLGGASAGIMYTRVPPRLGVSPAAAGAAIKQIAPTALAAIVDFLIMFSLLFLSFHFAARDPVSRAHLAQFRSRAAAGLDRDRAARMKHAAGRRIHRARHLALDRPERPRRFDRRIGHRHRVEQRARVGMQRMVEQLVAVSELDD